MSSSRDLRGWWESYKAAAPALEHFSIEGMVDLPSSIRAGVIYLVGASTKPKWAILGCPCGCGERIDVNLMRSRRPFWRARITHDGLTLSPSLWVSDDRCGSHFWIVDSRVLWTSVLASQRRPRGARRRGASDL